MRLTYTAHPRGLRPDQVSCGHKHKTFAAARRCAEEPTRRGLMTDMYNYYIRDSDGATYDSDGDREPTRAELLSIHETD